MEVVKKLIFGNNCDIYYRQRRGNSDTIVLFKEAQCTLRAAKEGLGRVMKTHS